MRAEAIKLTNSQKELREKMDDFMQSPEPIFLITGKPGVGKTTMTKIVLENLIRADRENRNALSMNVAGITLAHQAKNVLGEFIPNVFTFAKAYGMKEKIDKFTGKRTFEYNPKQRQNAIGKRQIPVFVHDEVSQYTQEMLDIVRENTSTYSKIIMIGDRAQLPPIDPDSEMGKDADSPVFRMELPENCKHELDERVRQAKGNPILDLSDIIREEIFGLQRIDRVLDAVNDIKMIDGQGYDTLAYGDLLDHIDKENVLNTKIIAFRNAKINKVNPAVRDHLLNNPKQRIVPGDIMTMKDNFYQEDAIGNMKCLFYNSEVLQIKDVTKGTKKLMVGGKKYEIESYKCKVKGSPHVFVVPTEEGQVQYNKTLKELKSKCLSRDLKWPEYYNFIGEFCEADYGYAITCYKAQGSTYDRVYIDIHDILNTGPLTRKRKLQTIYTAITRARYDVWFLT